MDGTWSNIERIRKENTVTATVTVFSFTKTLTVAKICSIIMSCDIS